MVLSRGLVISLGVSALGCTLLFLYFRNKISSVERKVDVMFDLIQNHQQEQMSAMNTMQKSQQNIVQDEIPQTGAWTEDNLQPERNLIDVSDDEEDADDSEEVSDSDDDSEEEDDEEEQPTLSLDKAEDMTLEVSEVKKINIQESDKVVVDNNAQLEEVEDVTDSLDEIDEDDDDEDEDEVEDEEDVNKETTEEVKEVVINKLDEEFDYNKLKVSELKAMAEAKNLEGYKSLKKGPLIELLKSNE
tara:strand:- start:194 stop:928 length:735 start_codon:yes stop_codon:yes gene_type:complete